MSFLADMQRSSLERVEQARERVPMAALRAALLAEPAPPALTLGERGFDLIAEFKLRSPSLGDLSADTLDPVRRLEGYAEGGAAMVSVLTEPTRFDGDLEHLRLAAATLQRYGVPVMRKDFLVDPYQLLEARAWGASGVLLIVRLLSRERLIEMLDCAREHDLFVLLEAFDAEDLKLAREVAAARVGCDEQVLMGLNCRNLDSLEIDFERFFALRSLMPPEWPAVAESGVQSVQEVARVARFGYRLALVGTNLMRSPHPEQAVRDLLAAGREALTR